MWKMCEIDVIDHNDCLVEQRTVLKTYVRSMLLTCTSGTDNLIDDRKSIPVHDNHDKKNPTPFTTPSVEIADS